MRQPLTILVATLLCISAHSQVSFTGSSSSINAITNTSPTVIDNAIVITVAGTIDAAKVAITANFAASDALSFNSGSLPAGVSGNYNSSTGILSFSGVATGSEYQALLRTVTFAASVAGTGSRIITFSLGSAVSYTANNHFYEYIPGSYTWTAAKADAPTRNLFGLAGYMATITSLGENDFIRQKVGADGWVGASDEYTQINTATGTTTYANQAGAEGNYYWVTGPEAGTHFSAGNVNPVAVGASYINWNSGEPNNWGNLENYLQIYITGSFPGKWNDLANSSTLGYIIEYGGMPGDPVVDLTHNRTITLTTVSTNLSTTGTANSYVVNSAAVIVDNAVTVSSTGNITDARVTISNNFQTGDQMSYNSGLLPAGVTGSYNSSTGVLSFTGTATPAEWQTLFRSVAFSSSGSVGSRTVTFSVGNLISAGNGHFYEFISASQTWVNAKALAGARSYMGFTGYLATITSQSENEFIEEKLSANGWIGASDRYTEINTATGATTYADQSTAESNWYWVTGPEAGTQFSAGNAPSVTAVSGRYNNWNSIEPNNSNGNEHYGLIYSTISGAEGKWNDESPSGTTGYVVEYGGLSTDPANNLSASRLLTVSAVLPLRDLSFNVMKKEEGVWLYWSTTFEQNTLAFEVLHSADNRSFHKIGVVAASGNSNSKKEYSYKHLSPATGNNYYKIRAVDIDGSTTMSETRLVNIKSSISLYPTVVNDGFLVNNPISSTVNLTIRNAVGATVLKQVVHPFQNSISAAAFPPGMYFAEFRTGDQLLQTIRFIKK